MKNKYLFESHISERQCRKILRYLSQDFDATKTNILTSISRITIHHIFDKLSTRIVYLLNQEEKLSGEVEIDESYFGARRVRGKQGQGTTGKVPVIGLLKRDSKVYTQIVRNCQRSLKETTPTFFYVG